MHSLNHLRATYRRLGTGELAAATAFSMAYLLVRDRFTAQDQIALGLAMVPLVLILVQAGAYWLLALRWVGVAAMPSPLAGIYAAFRWANPVVLAGSLGALMWWASTPGVMVLGVGLWLFAVVEQVNYFVRRLAYPASRWLTLVARHRTPQLMRDVRAGRGPDRAEAPR
ncbi:hypothetical protein LQF12_06695 [Ruania suaedae]|uniref:hypothetical protein n=1 Tax=Ruania suaedae TaxID=2897774 RepID=UPI001E5DD0D6|nr:hypothetical protein [Ruania suaedae]UFU04263.1 hypothetical protein LQF12_06695 [Ruania suaedae]